MTSRHVNGEAAAIRNRRADRVAEADFRGAFDKLFRPTGSSAMRKLGELRRELDKREYEVAANKRAVSALDAKFAAAEEMLDRHFKARAAASRPKLSTGRAAAVAVAGDDAGETDLDRALRKLRETN